MKVNDQITGTKPQGYTGETQGTPKDPKVKPSGQPGGEPAGGDKVQLSDRSREISHAQEVVKAAPDVRWDKVAEIKAKLEAGTYDVSAEKVADALLRTTLNEKI